MKKHFVSILAIATIAVSSIVPINVSAASNTQSMYRMYNWKSGEHFYTASVGERNHLVTTGWSYEGIGWDAPVKGTPVYRLYNPNAGDHHYTTSIGERKLLIRRGWRNEGIGWRSGGEVPLYRQYNPHATTGTHNYTMSIGENNALVKIGWKGEGIAWYGEKPEKGSSGFADGIYYGMTHNAGMDEMPEHHIDEMDISGRTLIISGTFEHMNTSWMPQGSAECQSYGLPLRSDTLFYQVPGEDEFKVMTAKEFVQSFKTGNIGPAVDIQVQNGYVITVSSGS